jgi:hypothetical protein
MMIRVMMNSQLPILQQHLGLIQEHLRKSSAAWRAALQQTIQLTTYAASAVAIKLKPGFGRGGTRSNSTQQKPKAS